MCFALKNSDHENEWERTAAAPLRRASGFHMTLLRVGPDFSFVVHLLSCRRLASPDQQSEGQMYF